MRLGQADKSPGAQWVLVFAFAGSIAMRGVQGFTDRLGLSIASSVADGMIIIAAIILALSPRLRRGHPTVAAGHAFLYIGWCAVSALLVSMSHLGMAVFGVRSMVLALVTVVLFQLADIGSSGRRVVLVVLLGVVIANCLVGLYQSVFGYSALEVQAIVANGSTYLVGDQFRLMGMQSSGQDFAVIVGAAFVWGVYQTARLGFRGAGVLVVLTTTLAGLCTLLVLQRSVLLGVAASLGVLGVGGFISSQRLGLKISILKRIVVVLSLFLVGATAVAMVAPAQFSEALNRITSFTQLSSDNSWAIRQRTTIPVTLGLIQDNPWGYGVGSSGSVATAFHPASPLAKYPLGGISADNGYFFIALQVGVIGLLLWLVMVAVWSWQGRLFSGFETARWNAAAVLLFLMGSMITGSFWGLASTMSLVLMFTSVSASRRSGNRHGQGSIEGPVTAIDASSYEAPGRRRTASAKQMGTHERLITNRSA